MDKLKRLTLQELLEGEVAVSLINEPVTLEPPRESATARAMRLWFKQNPVWNELYPDELAGAGEIETAEPCG